MGWNANTVLVAAVKPGGWATVTVVTPAPVLRAVVVIVSFARLRVDLVARRGEEIDAADIGTL